MGANHVTSDRARRLGLALVVLSLLVSLPYLWSRWEDEARTYRHVGVALDLEEWAMLANAHGGDLRALLADVRALGVNLLSLKAPTLGRLELEGALTIHDPLLSSEPPNGLSLPYQPGRLYVRVVDGELRESLMIALPLRANPGAVARDGEFIAIRGDLETVRALRGTFWSADLALAADLGFGVLLRPANLRGADPAWQLGVAPGAGFTASPGTVILHQGMEVIGYPDQLEATAEAMRSGGLVLGLLEAPLQLSLVRLEGLSELATLVDYRAVRVHGFSELELKKLLPDDLVDRSLRGVRDRGIGVLFLKAIPPAVEQYAWSAITEWSMRYYGGLTRDLATQGYTIGAAAASGVSDGGVPALTGLGGAAGAILILLSSLLDSLRPGRRLAAVLLLLPLALAPLALVARTLGGTGLMREFAAFAAAVTMPAAAIALGARVLGSSGNRARRGLGALGVATLAGLAGGLLVAGTLAGPLYTLEFSYFRGVKVAHLLPSAIVLALGILAWWRNEEGRGLTPSDLARRLGGLATSPLTWGAGAFAVAAAVGLYMILGRSGHTAGFQVSPIEVALRDLFDVRLYARPRFKEILLGHPALLFVAWFGLEPRGRWGWLWALALAGATIGQVSLVNSFCHIRTPLVVSLVRTLNGVWVGVLLAAAGFAALLLVWRVVRWLGRDA